jgi:bis(5'-nucleosyl)-tetraphosphatase (symmetrical)
MTTYIVGDIQGCYDPLRRLLDRIGFLPERDTLWSVGDLVNRGPNSLSVLRLLESLGDRFCGVLGNHDLHFLAVAEGVKRPKKQDTLNQLLEAPDLETHKAFVRQLPVVHRQGNTLMVHAGIPPTWNLEQTLARASELTEWIRGDRYIQLLEQMYDDQPARFEERLRGIERARVLTNVFTRMRFCSPDDTLDLTEKRDARFAPKGMKPWFAHSGRALQSMSIVFGHWAALEGVAMGKNVHALDTGCVWGKRLTAMDLETGERHSVPARRKKAESPRSKLK